MRPFRLILSIFLPFVVLLMCCLCGWCCFILLCAYLDRRCRSSLSCACVAREALMNYVSMRVVAPPVCSGVPARQSQKGGG